MQQQPMQRYSHEQVLRAATASLAKGMHFGGAFLPEVYTRVCVVPDGPRAMPADPALAAAQRDESAKRGEEHFRVTWDFPAFVAAPDDDDLPKKEKGVKAEEALAQAQAPAPSSQLPSPPGPLNLSVDITMPDGKIGCTSHSGGGGNFRRRPRVAVGAENADALADERAAMATAWAEYKAATGAVLAEVCAALKTSNYLSFNEQAALSKPSWVMTVGVSPSQFDVRCDTGSTVGWGVYARETREWSGLRHKHRRASPERTPLYCGKNLESFYK